MKKISKVTKSIKSKQVLKKMGLYLEKHHQLAHIYFILAIRTGYRVGDLIDLTVWDVKQAIKKKEFSIVEKKTEETRSKPKPRNVQIGEGTIMLLESYIKNKNNWEYIFPSPKGKGHFSIRQMGRIINKAAKEAGITYNVSNHGLRKTYGYLHFQKLFKDKKDTMYALLIVQEDFGHSTPEVTRRYIGLYDEEREASTKFFEEVG